MRLALARSLFAFSVLLLAACAAERPLPESTATSVTFSRELVWDELTLGPNDLVRVGVYGHPEAGTPIGPGPTGTRVDNEGLLSLPLTGPVAVGGCSVAQARERVREAITKYVQDPRVDLSVVEYGARRVYVYGEVQKPGAYVLDRPLNVYQGLALGGGFTPHARREQIVLLRGRPDALEVKVVDGETPNLDGLVALRPDDFLFVRRSGAGRFSDEVLPILTGISSALGSAATLLVLNDQLQ
ncbi:MAG: polysaccharide export protein [Planctomycetes bacterium]|nr:polysaccharide export protein [Planctomycetota bacterium]